MGKSTKFIILQFVKIKKIIRRIKMNVRYWQVWIFGRVFFDGQHILGYNDQAEKYFADSLLSIVILVLILQSETVYDSEWYFFIESVLLYPM